MAEDRCPPSFIDPVTTEMMRDPVTTADGHSYERAAIEKWLADHDTSPLTGAALSSRTLTPNHTLRKAIEEWRVENPLPSAGTPARAGDRLGQDSAQEQVSATGPCVGCARVCVVLLELLFWLALCRRARVRGNEMYPQLWEFTSGQERVRHRYHVARSVVVTPIAFRSGPGLIGPETSTAPEGAKSRANRSGSLL